MASGEEDKSLQTAFRHLTFVEFLDKVDRLVAGANRPASTQFYQEMCLLVKKAMDQVPNAAAKIQLVTKISLLYNDGKPFYTKAAFRHLEATVSDLRKPGQHIIEWIGVDGSKAGQPIKVEDEPDAKFMPLICLNNHYDMIHHAIYCGNFKGCKLNLTPLFVKADDPWPLSGTKNAAYWTIHFDEAMLAWEKSAEYKKFISALERCGDNLDKITKVICFGNGDFHPHGCDDHHHGPRAATQHAAALTVAKVLRERTGREILLLAQDPRYTDPVKEVLHRQGFTIYGDAGRATHGFIDVDEESFVMSISNTVPVKAIIADIARPAIFMTDGYVKGTAKERLAAWKNIGQDEEYVGTDPTNHRVKAMLEAEYDEVPLLHEKLFGDNHHPLVNVFIYNRKSKDAKSDAKEDKSDTAITSNAGNIDATATDAVQPDAEIFINANEDNELAMREVNKTGGGANDAGKNKESEGLAFAPSDM
ncbi:hypothetical protein BJ170DRAFT_617923 [Xylariales sp. AK1849]|nr:hypothetical protein BJ170DRAFT_617923 [Xylariales sp. AK1849]